jgi:hypothetical protein
MPIQFTLFAPPISTNGIYFYKTINDVSLNTFIGVGAASNYLELSGFINVNRFYANGAQLSSFANINGFDPKASNYQSKGAQLSGFANINGNNFTGFQGAGFANINKDFEGFQASSIINLNRNVKNSFQASGFANISQTTENSYQFAGFANISPKGKSNLQASGFANVASDIKGFQGSSFANVAHDVDGIQVSGFLNLAHNVKGNQVAGFINICDSIDGIPIGFISIVKKGGYRNFEVSTSEWSPVQLTYRMGIEKFYNVYTLSKLDGSWDRFALGFGFGHNRKIFNKTDLNIELVHHQEFLLSPNVINLVAERENSISQLKIGVRRNIFKNIWVNAGPTFNIAYAYKFNSTSSSPVGEELQPYLWKTTSKVFPNYPNYNTRFWVGFHAGISIN